MSHETASHTLTPNVSVGRADSPSKARGRAHASRGAATGGLAIGKESRESMLKPKQGDLVVAVWGPHRVVGTVLMVEPAAFWIETSDGEALRFALLAEAACSHGPETSH